MSHSSHRIWILVKLLNFFGQSTLLFSLRLFCSWLKVNKQRYAIVFRRGSLFNDGAAVPDHVTFLNQVTYSGNLAQTELPIERKPNQITFG